MTWRPRRSKHGIALPLGFALAVTQATACGETSERLPPVVRYDSAGIEIVQTNRPTWEEGEGWAIDPEPMLTIGRADGEDPYLFAQIVGVVRLEDGTIVLAEGQARELRYFDARGRFVRSAGRYGEGPGEFRNLRRLLRCGPDRLLAVESSPNVASVWTEAGEFLRQFDFKEPEAERLPYRYVCSPAGDFVAAGWGSTFGAPRRPEPWMGPANAPLWVLDQDAALVREFGEVMISERLFMPSGSNGPHPFGRSTRFAAGPELIYIGTSDRFEISAQTRTGEQVRILRGPSTGLEITDEFMEEYRAASLSEADSSNRAMLANADFPMPSTLPAFMDLRVTPDGHLWIDRFRLPWEARNRWGIFAPDGVFLGDIDLPWGLAVYEIGDDYVLGVVLDDFDVPEVRMYRVRR